MDMLHELANIIMHGTEPGGRRRGRPKKMLARQHQGMDGAASRQDPETSRRQRRLEKDHQNICGAPTAPQHQGTDGAASRQDPETSRRQRRLEKDHQNICGAPTAPQRLRAADADDVAETTHWSLPQPRRTACVSCQSAHQGPGSRRVSKLCSYRHE